MPKLSSCGLQSPVGRNVSRKCVPGAGRRQKSRQHLKSSARAPARPSSAQTACCIRALIVRRIAAHKLHTRKTLPRQLDRFRDVSIPSNILAGNRAHSHRCTATSTTSESAERRQDRADQLPHDPPPGDEPPVPSSISRGVELVALHACFGTAAAVLGLGLRSWILATKSKAPRPIRICRFRALFVPIRVHPCSIRGYLTFVFLRRRCPSPRLPASTPNLLLSPKQRQSDEPPGAAVSSRSALIANSPRRRPKPPPGLHATSASLSSFIAKSIELVWLDHESGSSPTRTSWPWDVRSSSRCVPDRRKHVAAVIDRGLRFNAAPCDAGP